MRHLISASSRPPELYSFGRASSLPTFGFAEVNGYMMTYNNIIDNIWLLYDGEGGGASAGWASTFAASPGCYSYRTNLLTKLLI